ncbi:COX15/CtaA family protein [Gallaecimonas xiamenensis]|uniref:Cytochrome oxidase assembly n=1 Tax=Gallaecimonas xiamenensis 3-C-1 TaxID=745411 RepID=K2J3A2_9GAMM|nr:COX15/CtaA family protein [Gallaecimonas xiamenensis]EKE77496.1 cytochrome oxidase assembly [Gallaecimonas xiamenensis 3-C-1]
MKILTWIAVLLALVVIGLGAYTRLTDAGLGCPDWPGCYGHLTVPSTDHHLAKAEASFPGVPVEPHKAWNEMIHRYFAGILGLCIFALFSLACWYRARERGLALALLSLVVFQALLGMWTVTMSLRPAIVMGHLLGGFCTLALLWLMGLRLSGWRVPGGEVRLRHYRHFAGLVLVVLVVQIALGGWTSSNYAALACTQLPFCEGQWWTRLHPEDAFNLVSPPAENYQYGVLGYEARMTIHVTHRLGALVTALLVSALAVLLLRHGLSGRFRQLGWLLFVLVLAQVGLGVANVVLMLPLPVALAHNLVAVLLLLSLVTVNYGLWRKA